MKKKIFFETIKLNNILIISEFNSRNLKIIKGELP